MTLLATVLLLSAGPVISSTVKFVDANIDMGEEKEPGRVRGSSGERRVVTLGSLEGILERIVLKTSAIIRHFLIIINLSV